MAVLVTGSTGMFGSRVVELHILCHFRQMRAGNADLVTDTFESIMGRPSTSVFEWATAHRDQFPLE